MENEFYFLLKLLRSEVICLFLGTCFFIYSRLKGKKISVSITRILFLFLALHAFLQIQNPLLSTKIWIELNPLSFTIRFLMFLFLLLIPTNSIPKFLSDSSFAVFFLLPGFLFLFSLSLPFQFITTTIFLIFFCLPLSSNPASSLKKNNRQKKNKLKKFWPFPVFAFLYFNFTSVNLTFPPVFLMYLTFALLLILTFFYERRSNCASLTEKEILFLILPFLVLLWIKIFMQWFFFCPADLHDSLYRFFTRLLFGISIFYAFDSLLFSKKSQGSLILLIPALSLISLFIKIPSEATFHVMALCVLPVLTLFAHEKHTSLQPFLIFAASLVVPVSIALSSRFTFSQSETLWPILALNLIFTMISLCKLLTDLRISLWMKLIQIIEKTLKIPHLEGEELRFAPLRLSNLQKPLILFLFSFLGFNEIKPISQALYLLLMGI